MSEPARIDLNADAGESFGPWRMGTDEALFASLTSVNVACGFHAGDPSTIRRTIELAVANDLAVGAHPGFPDRVGFGRRDLRVAADELHDDVLYQLGALEAFLRPFGRTLHHVKPHGAMHHLLVRDADAADAAARAIASFDRSVPYVVLAGPAGAVMRRAAEANGLSVVLEAFPDRGYLADGRLAPRGEPEAMIQHPDEVARRAVAMVAHGEIAALDGGTVPIEAQTLCIHGDTPGAAATASAVHRALRDAGVDVAAF